MALFNGIDITLTDRYKDALQELAEAEREMLNDHFREPYYVWSSVSLDDLVYTQSISIDHGIPVNRPSCNENITYVLAEHTDHR